MSHATRLVATLAEDELCTALELDKPLGESELSNRDPLEVPAWKWPGR